MSEINTPLSFTTHISQSSQADILSTGSDSPTNIQKSPGTSKKFQTFSLTLTRQEKSNLVTTETDLTVTKHQKGQISPEQETSSRISRSSAIKGHEIMPSSTSTPEPVVSDYTHSVARNDESNKVPKSIHVSSTKTKEIRETTTVMKTLTFYK